MANVNLEGGQVKAEGTPTPGGTVNLEGGQATGNGTPNPFPLNLTTILEF